MFWKKWRKDKRKSAKVNNIGDLAVSLIAVAVSCADAVEDHLQKRARRNSNRLPTARWFLHLADRIAFETAGAERRSAFVSGLFAKICEAIAGGVPERLSGKFGPHASVADLSKVSVLVRERLPQGGLESLGKVTMDIFSFEDVNERSLEYAKMKLFPDKEPIAGTLFWEFGKHLSEVAAGQPKDITIVSLGSAAASKLSRSLCRRLW